MKDIRIIPAPLPYTVDELNEKLRRVDAFADRVQVDIVGKAFSSKVTIGVEALENIGSGMALDIQLMVREPISFINRCDIAGADRVYGQVEYMKDKIEFVEYVLTLGMQAGLGLDLKTPVEEIEDVISDLDAVLLMSVPAGKSGQKFNSSVLDKVRAIREVRADIPICVDGGIRPKNISACVKVGADEFAVGKFLWESEDIAGAIKELMEAVE